jgi:menaquinone-specific isochorismate synthase
MSGIVSPKSSLKIAHLSSPENFAEFLSECYLSFLQARSPRLVSVAFQINRCDSLAVLREFSQTYRYHFYFERDQHCSLGIGKAIQLTVESRDRFAQTRDLIGDLATQMLQVTVGAAIRPQPRFFCNFSFFEQHQAQNSPTPQAAILLPRWQIEQDDGNTFAIVNLVLHPDFMPEMEADRTWQELVQLKTLPERCISSSQIPRFTTHEVTSSEAFQDSVRQALRCIENGQLDKIVLARALDVQASQPFDLLGSLRNLRDRYPHCYIFSATCGTEQTFIGASPERLVSIQNGELKTEALAGSAPRGKTETEDAALAAHLLNSDKEAHEHRFVVDFITQKLDGLGVMAELGTPRLLQLSNIQHRQTPIAAKVPVDVHVLDVVAALHPTPAMAGLPREIACQHIQHYEKFDRSWYAAPIGWVDTVGNGEFAVGIRSAMLCGDRARLFAGAGIVAGSVPERELNEVQLKLQALLQALV